MKRNSCFGLPWIGRALGFTLVSALGCSGRVDLGQASAAPASSATKPITNEIELLAQTESLARVTRGKLASIAVDASYLYLDAVLLASERSHSLQRCLKSDCWHTMKPLRQLGWLPDGIALSAGQLGWVNDQGLMICSAPDCADARVEPGVVVEPGLGGPPILWTRDRVYWYLDTDHAIYGCDRPDCTQGPQQIANQVEAHNLILIGDQLYLFDYLRGEMQRTSVDGNGTKERLTQEEQTAWTPVLPGPVPDRLIVDAEQIDGAWIYAAFRSNPPPPCSDCTQGFELARWRYAEEGAPREWILSDDDRLDPVPNTLALVSDGEVIWTTVDRALWSCVADNCSGTTRQLGIDAMVGFGRGIVADDQFIYWLSAPCDGDWQCEPDWNLKRTPRIAQ